MSEPRARFSIAYADPPYPGQAKRHYGKENTYAGEVDHVQLALLLRQYDGWALSTSSAALPMVLPIFHDLPVRIGAWVKPFAIFKPGVNPAYAWEPVIFKPARSGVDRFGGRNARTVRDWCSTNVTLKRGLVGAKPQGFCDWLFDLLGMEPDDQFADLFPGTGAVTDAWKVWRARERVVVGGQQVLYAAE